MRAAFIILFITIWLAGCSSTKVVPAMTAGTSQPPPVSAIPPAVAPDTKRIDYADSSDNGSLIIEPKDGNLVVVEHITISGQLREDQPEPRIRITIWQLNGEQTEHTLNFSIKDGSYLFDNDVSHRLQPGQHAIIDIYQRGSGDIYPAKIKATGYQEKK